MSGSVLVALLLFAGCAAVEQKPQERVGGIQIGIPLELSLRLLNRRLLAGTYFDLVSFNEGFAFLRARSEP